MSKKKVIIGVVLVAVLALLTSGVVFAMDYASVTGKVDDKLINESIFIGDVDVSGLTTDQAKEKIQEYLDSLGENTVTLLEEENGNKVKVPVNELGLSCSNTDKVVKEAMNYGKSGGFFKKYNTLKKLKKDKKVFDLEMAVDQGKVKEIVSAHSEEFESPAMDATIKKTKDGFDITEDTTGIVVDIEKTSEKINKFMSETLGKKSGEIALVVTVDKPEVTSEALTEVKDLLGSFNTNFGSSASGRAMNIQSGANHINGTVIMPGKTFSTHEVVTPFTKDNGYAMAGSYANGEVVQSMGGGICQVSTTLYNTVLRAELEVVERHPHSMTVSYVKPASDAAIAGTSKDLKFKNNTDAPIYIEGYVVGRDLHFNIYGKETRAANRTIEFESETLSHKPAGVQLVGTGAAIGSKSTSSGHDGKVAKLYKVIYKDGVEVERIEVNKSSYSASAKKIQVGTATADAQAAAEVNAAIAANNEGAYNAAVAGAKAREQQRQQEEQQTQPPEPPPETPVPETPPPETPIAEPPAA